MSMSIIPNILGRGIAADRPDASAVGDGTLYHSTDTGVIEQARGGVWVSYQPGSAPPSGAAGGVLDGTYPNPDFAAAAAASLPFVPAGSIAATDVQAAIEELDTEKASTGSVATVATAISDHLADAADAHDASAIAFTPAGTIAATTVQAAIEEVAAEGANLLNNFAATTDPTANDDSGDGYAVGSRWINVTDDTAWTCVDDTLGAAVWVESGGGASAALTVQEEDGTPSDTAVVLFKVPNGWLTDNGAGDVSLTPPAVAIAAQLTTLTFIIDGGGSAIATGIKGDLEMPFAGEIEQVTLLADQSGSIVIDLWKDTYANFPPTDADSITAAAPPTISAATKAQDGTLTGWTTTVAQGDILRVNVDSAATVQRVSVAIRIRRTA